MPERSRFFDLLEFHGGRMYHVFTEDEIRLWRDWVWELGEEPDERRRGLRALRNRLAAINSDFIKTVSDDQLRMWQRAAADYRIALWVEIASAKAAAPDALGEVSKVIKDRFDNWLGWSMIRGATYIASEYREAVKGLDIRLPDPADGRELTIAEWFERIREARNSAFPARAMLKALGERLHSDGELPNKWFNPDGPLFYAFDSGIPGNDGRKARTTLRAWFDAGFPLPEVPKGWVKPLRMDASLNEEECHPTGVAMGFGTVH